MELWITSAILDGARYTRFSFQSRYVLGKQPGPTRFVLDLCAAASPQFEELATSVQRS